MRIAIATGGRFHVLDLARELDAIGHTVAFYSYVPRFRARKFGLPARCHVSLLPVMAPTVAARMVAPRSWAEPLSRLDATILDHIAARFLRPCDVLVAMSGLFVATLRRAKQEYSAAVILERGSQHILSQDRILRAMPNGKGIDPFFIERELIGYEIADFVSVPSRHVVNSFLEHDFPKEKLLLNPYGCDLKLFPPTTRAGPLQKTLLFVGLWSLQKGCDVLVEAWRGLTNVRLLHVGPVGDMPLPEDVGFSHVPTVSQERLSRFYAESDVFVLASRQEGYGMVLNQALASGLPLVCTTMTGGPDLRLLLGCHDVIFEVSPDDPVALKDAILRALALSDGQPDGTPRILIDSPESLSWRRYGVRYDRYLQDKVGVAASRAGS